MSADKKIVCEKGLDFFDWLLIVFLFMKAYPEADIPVWFWVIFWMFGICGTIQHVKNHMVNGEEA